MVAASQISAREAQYRLLYSVVVAGHSADFARVAMQRFMADAGRLSPYSWINILVSQNRLEEVMRNAKMGCYRKLERSFREIAAGKPDLRTARPHELERYHGVGRKTSRFAIMWIRPQERFAALDTHVLKWLRFIGHDAPKATPPGEAYERLERIFIQEADRRGFNPRLLDAMIWCHASTLIGRGDPFYVRMHGVLLRGQSVASDEGQLWPAWLRKEPAIPPPLILEYFHEFAV